MKISKKNSPSKKQKPANKPTKKKTKPSKPVVKENAVVGLTEAETLACIEYIVDYLSPGFVFYPFELDDIKQHARMVALKALPRFNPNFKKVGTLEEKLRAFLFDHVKKRLINLQRDNGAGSSKEEKKKLNRASSIYSMDETHEAQISEEIDPEIFDVNRMKQQILSDLDPDLRHTYHKVLANLSVPKGERDRLFNRIREILGVGENAEEL